MIELLQVKPKPLSIEELDKNSQTWLTKCTFKKGSNYLVTAPSGKGKSTLVHIIYGIRKDYEGEVLINDQLLDKYSPNDWSKMRQETLSVVFQDLRLFPNLTALDNILLKAQMNGNKSIEDIELMADKLGVKMLLNKPASTLSYGQQQRIAIIRSLCQPFEFLLLDEPFSHLDTQNIKIASKMIKKACTEQNAGLILVSLGDRYYFDYDHEIIL